MTCVHTYVLAETISAIRIELQLTRSGYDQTRRTLTRIARS